MLEWRGLFSYTILTRGKRYFNSGRVSGLSMSKNRILARVRGTRSYVVSMQISGGKVQDMTCGCAYAKGGSKCKHMAAVLFAAEDSGYLDAIEESGNDLDGGEEKTLGEWLAAMWKENPKEAPPENVYRYYDPLVLGKNIKIAEQKWKQARAMASQGKVILTSVSTGYGAPGTWSGEREENRPYGCASGMFKARNGRQSELTLVFTHEGIVRHQCEASSCIGTNRLYAGWGTRQNDDTLCVHETALFLCLTDWLLKENPGDATDKASNEFLDRVQGKLAKEKTDGALTAQAGQQVQLQPRLSDNREGGLQLSFRIGNDKFYVLKNMLSLVQEAQKGGKLEFGTAKKEWISVREDCFTGKNAAYLDLLTAWNQEDSANRMAEKLTHRSAYYYEAETPLLSRRECSLYGRWLDWFYEISKGDTVEYTPWDGNAKSKQMLRLQEKEPKIMLKIEPVYENGTFSNVSVTGRLPHFYQGETYAYYIEGDALNRVGRAYFEQLAPIFAQEKNQSLELRIGRNRLSAFYYTVLPWLEQYANVDSPKAEEIEPYLPPKAQFVFYLDAEGNDAICRAESIYGAQHFSPADFAENRFAEQTPSSAGMKTIADFVSPNELNRSKPLQPKENSAAKAAFRDRMREQEVLDTVLHFFPVFYRNKDEQTGRQEANSAAAFEKNPSFCCDGDESLVFEVLNRGVKTLLSLGEVQATDRFKRLRIRKHLKWQVGVSIQSSLLDLSVSADDLAPEELLAVLESYRNHKRFHRLKNGEFIPIEDAEMQKLSTMLDTLRISPKEFVKGKMHIPAYRALYLDRMLEDAEGIYIERDKHYKRLIKDFKTVQDAEFEVPASLKKILRSYQKTGYRWLRTLESGGFGGILADDMGLGKTLQVIAVLLAAKEEGNKGVSLIAAPASLVYNWLEELNRFAPALSAAAVAGTQTERANMLEAAKRGAYDVLITSYDLLKRDISLYEGISFHYEVIDEAQAIKNHTTAAAKAVKVIQSSVRYALTGTPIENRLSELWSIFDYLMPGFLFGYETFRREIELPAVKNHDKEAMERLRMMASPFILRRLKQDVLKDLPEKLEEVRYAAAEAEQQKLCDAEVLKLKNMLSSATEENLQKNRMQILAELTRIRQLCCDPALLFADYKGGSAKRELCMELIHNAIDGGHRLLIFSQFTSMLALLEAALAKESISYYKITGETPKEERVQLVHAFNEGSVPVFLISLKAGGTGLNLTGADMVIHYDPWWNIAAQNQATDRAHRIGQTHVVTVYKLILKGSIEEKILKLQEDKQALSDEVLNGENGMPGGFSKEALLALFS